MLPQQLKSKQIIPTHTDLPACFMALAKPAWIFKTISFSSRMTLDVALLNVAWNEQGLGKVTSRGPFSP